MDKKTVLGIIGDFKTALDQLGVRVQKVILYGSFASDRHREDSDIDLVVISEDFQRKNYWERIDLLSAAIYKVFQPIEAVAMTPQEWESGNSFITDYAKNGEVVYG